MSKSHIDVTAATQEQLFNELSRLATLKDVIEKQLVCAQGWHKYRLLEAHTETLKVQHADAITAANDVADDYLRQLNTAKLTITEYERQIADLMVQLAEERAKHSSLLKDTITAVNGKVESGFNWTERDREFAQYLKEHPTATTAMLAKRFQVTHSTIYNWKLKLTGHPVPNKLGEDPRRQINGYLGRRPNASVDEIAQRFHLSPEYVRDYLAPRMTVITDGHGVVEEVAFHS